MVILQDIITLRASSISALIWDFSAPPRFLLPPRHVKLIAMVLKFISNYLAQKGVITQPLDMTAAEFIIKF